MEPTAQEIQRFDLLDLGSGQQLIVCTSDGATLTIQVPQDAVAIIAMGRSCVSKARIFRVPRERQTIFENPSRAIMTGRSWQYGESLHSPVVRSMTLLSE